MTRIRIPGYCPMGCGETLIAASAGHITCTRLTCPRPTAVDELLSHREHEHVVEIKARTFTVRHPLRERLDDELMTCTLDEWLVAQPGPPYAPGRYRVEWRGEATDAWLRLDGAS